MLIKEHFPMLHTTCLVHDLYRVSEFIRDRSSDVNRKYASQLNVIDNSLSTIPESVKFLETQDFDGKI